MADDWLSVRAPAKLNLYLELLSRRDDGFHELETVMVPLRLADSLQLRSDDRSSAIRLRIDGPQASTEIPTDANNLVVRGLELLRESAGVHSGAEVRLTKRIPARAGLGGGSSDAAAALALGNIAWGLHLSVEQLLSVAAQIGSDVPFFLTQMAAVCRGRGELVEPVAYQSGLACVLVKPPVGLSTAEVYSIATTVNTSVATTVPPQTCGAEQVTEALRSGNWSQLGAALHNRLQPPAEQLTPWIGKLREMFAGLPVIGHQMTGSGSAYFGLCRSARQARRVSTQLQQLLGFQQPEFRKREEISRQDVGWVTATAIC